jgi:CBS domain-containing protein
MRDSQLPLIPDETDREPPVREFFRVARLIPHTQDVVTIPPGTKVRDALTIMDRNGFSQLPVVAGSMVIGVLTHRSLAQNLHTIRRQDDPLEAPVDDLLEDLTFVRASDDVGRILGDLDRDGAVLVGDEENLVALATTTDVIEFFWQAARPFILLQDIELAVRDLMRIACNSTEELAARIATALPGPNSTRRNLAELTLGEIVGVLTNGENFGQCFTQTFGPNRTLVLGHLEAVREIRNQVVHFRDDVSVEQLSTLVSTRQWLLRKIKTVRSGR